MALPDNRAMVVYVVAVYYWKQLAPATAHALCALIWLLYPFVKLSKLLTRGLTEGPGLTGFNPEELAAMAELSAREMGIDIED